jgi:uncharacterized protein (DUF1015 family)
VRERAVEVVAPPYDILTVAEARAQARDRPWSFLHISRPEVDLPPGTGAFAPEVYAKGADTLRRMLEAGVLRRDPAPCYYVYRLSKGDHHQTGLAAAASLAAYADGRIRRHEFTRPDKEQDRVRNIEAIGAQTGPALLAHRPAAEVAALLQRLASGSPACDVAAADGSRHAVWVVAEADAINRISALFGGLGALYIADGHHRSAAAARVAAARRAENPRHRGDEPYNGFLAVVFPSNELRILDYNRVVRDLGGLSAEAFLDKLTGHFTVTPSSRALRPVNAHEFGAYLAGQWYRLVLREPPTPAGPTLAHLDVNLLSVHVLEPILGIGDPRHDPRIEFVGGARGMDELERRVDGGEMAVAFTLRRTCMEEVMAVADAGKVMPPKSTWFEPKLADGLISLPLD